MNLNFNWKFFFSIFFSPLKFFSGSFSMEKNHLETKKRNSGFITCLVCNQTKYYSHVQRRYGIFRLVSFFFEMIFFNLNFVFVFSLYVNVCVAVNHVLNFFLVFSKNQNIFNVMIMVRYSFYLWFDLFNLFNNKNKNPFSMCFRWMFNRINQWW